MILSIILQQITLIVFLNKLTPAELTNLLNKLTPAELKDLSDLVTADKLATVLNTYIVQPFSNEHPSLYLPNSVRRLERSFG